MAKDDKTKKTAAGTSKKPDLIPDDDYETGISPFSMAGIRRGSVGSRFFKSILLLLIFIFAAGFLITSFNPGGEPGPVDPQRKFQSRESVAQVGDDAIEKGAFETI